MMNLNPEWVVGLNEDTIKLKYSQMETDGIY